MSDVLTLISAPESETVERKEAWKDDCYKALAAFANTRGGTLLVGVADDGQVIGWHGDAKELEQITNWITGNLRVLPATISVQSEYGTPVLVVEMARSPTPVAVRGIYYRRVGNSTREIPSENVQRFLLERSGLSWDGLPCDFTLKAISEEAIENFKALAGKRLPMIAPSDGKERLLDNLRLIAPDGRLLRAAILLFGEHTAPQRLVPTAQVQVGRFKDYTTMLDDKLFEGNLFQQLDAVMQQFQQYFQVRYEFRQEMGDPSGVEAMQRIEVWDYPLGALREAVANALLHRDYTSQSSIMIRVFDDHVTITSPGSLPEGVTLADLYHEPHPSRRRNVLLADGFYYAGIVEKWGSGTTRMARLCAAQNLPGPEFTATPYEFTVTFYKDPYTPERLQCKGLTDGQIRIVQYIREHSSITNREVRALLSISDEAARKMLNSLLEHAIIQSEGQGRNLRYILAQFGD